MHDYQAAVEKLRKDAAEAALIRDLATNSAKRETFDRLYRHLNGLANEVERVMNTELIASGTPASVCVMPPVDEGSDAPRHRPTELNHRTGA